MKTMQYIMLFLLLLGVSNYYTQQKATLNVAVTDFQNHALNGEQIFFVNRSTQEIIKGTSDKGGNFTVDLPGGITYDIKIKSIGDATDYNTLAIPAIGPNEQYGVNSMQIMIEQPKQFTLNNVLFDSGKSTLKSSSYEELNELVEFLKLKPELEIMIAGHTDNIGDLDKNLLLSKNRAYSVMNYLIDQGIDANRLMAKGFGSSSPISDNSTEAGRKQNRRTEIHLLN